MFYTIAINMKCKQCGKLLKENTEGNKRYCQGHSIFEKAKMDYYFNVKETEAHDEELAVIEAGSLAEAKKIFAGDHPEDVKNVYAISSDEDMILDISFEGIDLAEKVCDNRKEG